jgi:hypothetical protein
MIRATMALLDGASIGRPLLAFVHVGTTSWPPDQVATLVWFVPVSRRSGSNGQSRLAGTSPTSNFAG